MDVEKSTFLQMTPRDCINLTCWEIMSMSTKSWYWLGHLHEAEGKKKNVGLVKLLFDPFLYDIMRTGMTHPEPFCVV